MQQKKTSGRDFTSHRSRESSSRRSSVNVHLGFDVDGQRLAGCDFDRLSGSESTEQQNHRLQQIDFQADRLGEHLLKQFDFASFEVIISGLNVDLFVLTWVRAEADRIDPEKKRF